jgi:DNA ligase-1
LERFARLFADLDRTNKTNEKVRLLVRYLDDTDDRDKLWAIALFLHKRPKRQITTGQLRMWTRELAGIPEWLFDESYGVVGDLAETISLLTPQKFRQETRSLSHWIDFLRNLHHADDTTKRTSILDALQSMDSTQKYVFIKLLTGGFRVGISKNLLVRALSQHTGIEKTKLMHRLTGNWTPNDTTYTSLIHDVAGSEDLSKPYPFYLAYPLEDAPTSLGDVRDWQAEWKWDGIRCQVVVRGGQLYLWSRGEDLITESFPELAVLAQCIPGGTVLDGELLAYKSGSPLNFGHLQTRLGRKRVTAKLMDSSPALIMAYDLLEWKGQDYREHSLGRRRQRLLEVCAPALTTDLLKISPVLQADSWSHLEQQQQRARRQKAEGIMLKRISSPYGTGRIRGDWWKWKVDPLTIDGVLLYAQKGHGRRADIYSDYTFAVWDGDALVPFAKAYSGLTDREMAEVDRFVKQHIKEKFGPVRTVDPELVFEIAFEGIRPSGRHKSGIAVRFPRIARWRRDKKPEDANTVDDLKKLLQLYGQ